MMAAGKQSSSHFLCPHRRHICKHVKGLAEFRRQLVKVFNNPFEILGTPRFDLPFLVGGIICMHCMKVASSRAVRSVQVGFTVRSRTPMQSGNQWRCFSEKVVAQLGLNWWRVVLSFASRRRARL